MLKFLKELTKANFQSSNVSNLYSVNKKDYRPYAGNLTAVKFQPSQNTKHFIKGVLETGRYITSNKSPIIKGGC